MSIKSAPRMHSGDYTPNHELLKTLRQWQRAMRRGWSVTGGNSRRDAKQGIR